MKSPHRLLLMLTLIPLFKCSTGLNCYSCSVTATSGDKNCVDDPANVQGRPTVQCTKKYCTIFRQEMKDPPGKVNSFVRGCEEEPIFLDEIIEDDDFITYYRSCTVDLCNSDDGVQDSNDFNTPERNGGANLVVPGLPSSSGAQLTPIIHAVLLAVTFLMISTKFLL